MCCTNYVLQQILIKNGKMYVYNEIYLRNFEI